MSPTVYVETSLVGYLRARPNAQVVAAARQYLTRQWWEYERHQFELVTSQFVLDEAAKGSPSLAAERLLALKNIRTLEIPADLGALADSLLDKAALPIKARLDALHIAIAACHGIDYLLTWNCAHIANARMLPRIHNVLKS